MTNATDQLKEAFEGNDIEIPFSQRAVHIVSMDS
jgi:small-conductance mechanosensitive channel